jgi:hypothetical protein
MAKHLLDNLRVLASGEMKARGRVTQIMYTDPLEPGLLECQVKEPSHSCRLPGPTILPAKDQGVLRPTPA